MYSSIVLSILTAEVLGYLISFNHVVAGVYLAERLNRVMGDYWRSFASQNYFDPHGLFLSVLWSGPLLIIATIILINSLFSLCYMIVRWKRAELRHRARLARRAEELVEEVGYEAQAEIKALRFSERLREKAVEEVISPLSISIDL
ncbi:hypothetical protein H0E87_030495 [Populus deltoides]|uniref:Transmembrane protein 18 n=1 Tax=Populus deltoides TaxID=3696 RepID=A0A8T2WHA9_POPDE|nr:hypothetical protein H0E87_030495 [Populus deltoides]